MPKKIYKIFSKILIVLLIIFILNNFLLSGLQAPSYAADKSVLNAINKILGSVIRNLFVLT